MFHKVLNDRVTKPDLVEGYRVDAIRDADALTRLAADWRSLQDRDPEAGLFLSFDWMAAVLDENPGCWRVFVVRGAKDGVCRLIFPAWLDRATAPDSGEPHLALRAAGRLAWAEYTGFLCDPAWAAPALTVLAQYLSRHEWDGLALKYLHDADRAGIFAGAFDPARFRVTPRASAINAGRANELICPRVQLPRDFDAYLTGLSRNRREKMRQHLLDHVDTGEMRLTVATPAGFDADLELMLELWRRRWAGEKSPSRVAEVVSRHRRLFRICNGMDAAHISMLWHRDRPIGALGLIADAGRNEMLVRMTGRDPDCADLPVGRLLHLLTIRWAITRGVAVYDFGHGNEPYKYSFGATDRPLIDLAVSRRTDPVADAAGALRQTG